MTRKNALVVRGGWEGHQPVRATELFLPFLRANGYAVRIEESTDVYADAAAMAGTDLVVQCVTMSQITAEQLAGLSGAVVAGTGFTGWHGGIADSFRASSDYLHLVGGQFATHPGKEPCERRGGQEDNYLPHSVNITELGREHPVTAGEVTGRCQGCHGRTGWVVVASTSIRSSWSTQYCSVSSSKSSMPAVTGCSRPSSVMLTLCGR